jgi:hypothetical protein
MAVRYSSGAARGRFYQRAMTAAPPTQAPRNLLDDDDWLAIRSPVVTLSLYLALTPTTTYSRYCCCAPPHW